MPSNTAPKNIVLRGDPIYSELAAKASEAIKPGMLVERASDGTLQKHATAAGPAVPSFAKELDFAGGEIDSVYADGDTVPFVTARPGDWIYAFVATGNNVAIGAQLQSAGTGALELVDAGEAGEGATHTVVAGTPLCVALEAVNNSSGSDARIKVEVL